MYRFTPRQIQILGTWSVAQRFWLQSWFELLHEFSASFFRVRPIPVSAVAAELQDSLVLWKRGSVSTRAVEDIRKELLQLVPEDPILPEVWIGERDPFLSALGGKFEAEIQHLSWSASQLSRRPFAQSYLSMLIKKLDEADA